MKSILKPAFFLTFLAVAIGSGQGLRHTGREMLLEEDILTPQQMVKVKEIRIETEKTIIPIRAQIELKEIDLKSEMEKDSPNKEKILEISKEIHELEWQVKKAHLEERLKIHSLLTPEQREKMRIKCHRMMKKEIEIRKEKRE